MRTNDNYEVFMWDSEPLLAVRGMRKSFGRLEVLTGVDIDLRHGEVLGIVGPNGAVS